MRKLILTTAAVAAALAGAFAAEPSFGTFTDARDGKTYKTTVIGGKRWMAENLNYKPQKGKSWCYNDSVSYCDKYGKLYDYYMARSLCPSGWRLPTITDWGDLIRAAGGEKASDGGDDDEGYADYGISWRGAGKTLRAKSGWDDFQGKNGGGTDGYGFSALPGGGCFDLNYDCAGAGRSGRWWTATEVKPGHSYYVDINNADSVDADYTENYYSFSVRCIQKDSAWYNLEAEEREERKKEAKQWKKEAKERFVPNYFTDSRDKQKYRAVKIDGKTWMAENLNYAAHNSWCYDNDDSYCDKYGRLYDWKTAATACPSGWHLPTRVEWDKLVTAAGGETIAGKKLKSENSWDERGHSGTDDYGFSALSGGIRDADDSRFKYADGYGAWWTAAETYGREMYDSEHGSIFESDYNTNNGLSVRCVADRP
jgi:uncharacterized protein (TIGR02145 family)